MKTLITKAKAVIMFIALYVTVNAQVIDLQNVPGQRWGRLNPAPGFNAWALGIGNFNSPTSPASALHVNTNLIPTPYYGAGEVFRTECPAGIATYWRMFQGTNPVGRIYYDPTLGTFNDLTIEAAFKNENILFKTNTFSRMIIRDGAIPATDGFIGIGSNFYLPQSLLHLDNTLATSNNYIQFTNGASTTPYTVNSGMRIGLAQNSTTAEIRQEENAPIDVYTFGSQKMRLNADNSVNGYGINGYSVGTTSVTVNTSGYLLISPKNTPVNNTGGPKIYTRGAFSLLHLNDGNGVGTFVQDFGFRPWMKCGITFTSNNDLMYVGHKSNGKDITDAVFQWSDNLQNAPNGPDVLKFVFTGGSTAPSNTNTNPLDPNSMDGLELMRMVVQSNTVTPTLDNYGKIGIGPLFTNALPPARRLEVHDGRTGNPQLRLSYQLDPNPSLGIWTDFQTTSNGDLAILPFNSTFTTTILQPRFVGIQTTTPGNTVEINSPVTSSVTPTPALTANTTTGYLAPNTLGGTGMSGLRFTDLTSASTPIPTASFVPTGFLTVDNNGDVILVPGGRGGGIGLCTAPIATTNIAGDSRIGLNNFNVFFDGNGAGAAFNNVLIGKPCSLLPQAKLDVLQSSGSTNTIGINILNTDVSSGIKGSPQPVIGIKSKMPPPSNQFYQVAGWFETPPDQYAIFVPAGAGKNVDGGTVDIGYSFNTDIPDFILDVSKLARIAGTTVGSDSILKTDVSPFNAGLNVIRNLNPKFYHYNGKGGFDTQHQYIGVMAQEVASVAPYAVDSSFQKLDSSDTAPTQILNVYNEAIMYTSLNAIKQLDSAVTVLENAPTGISGTGTTNFITKWSGANSVTASQMFDNGTNVGVGTSSPQNKFDVVRGAAGVMGKATYESASIERNGDTKMGIYSSTSNTGDGASLTFGFTNLNETSGLYPGFEMQELYSSNPSQNIMRFNSISRTSGGSVVSANPNILNILGNGNIGIGTSNPSERLHVVGNILATGTITQNSDAALKQNVDSISNALQIIAQLKPHSFNFDTAQYSYMGLPSGKQYGIIAQEAESILPEIVHQSVFPEMKDYNGNSLNPETHYKTVNYTALIPILIQAFKEERASKDSLRNQLNALQAIVNNCCSSNTKTTGNNSSTSQVDVNLASKKIVLDQNSPNPFKENTTITYFIPKDANDVKIIFTDMSGEIIKEVAITEKGKGQLNVYASDLSSGIYTYSIVADGMTLDTKKMLKSK
ncbi:MAG: tail fiber domain-containing protein [Bacteroidetes bacterium]|nr:tail fiber domain-containing protein [Bacteroidota bacterium]